MAGTGLSTLKANTGAGTLQYKAPESFDGKYEAASEVYAFAIIMWEVLTGKLPWDGMLDAQVTKEVYLMGKRPPWNETASPLVTVVEQCWAQVRCVLALHM